MAFMTGISTAKIIMIIAEMMPLVLICSKTNDWREIGEMFPLRGTKQKAMTGSAR